MNEIDLFPDDLRKKLLFSRWFKMAGYVAVLISMVLIVAFVLLRQANEKIDLQIQPSSHNGKSLPPIVSSWSNSI